MKMHALVCVWVLHFKIDWRLLAVFRSNRGSVADNAVNSGNKCLYLLLLFIPHESHFVLGDTVTHWATKYKVNRMSK